jgi:hypothetical protein
MTHRADRRTNHALRRRVDQMLERVHEARAEIVERGLDAVRGSRPQPGTGAPRPRSSTSR